MFTSVIITGLVLLVALGLSPSVLAQQELDVQVYRGDGSVGIIVSQGPSHGFDVVLDENSTVIVSGSNSSGVGDGGGNNDASGTGNETVIDNCDIEPCLFPLPLPPPVVVGENETSEKIEIPHIGSYPITYYNTSESGGGNESSTIEVTEEVTGVDVDGDGDVGSNERSGLWFSCF